MSHATAKASLEWRNVGLVGTAGFLYFSAGSLGLAWISDQARPTSTAALGTRFVVSIVVAVLMSVVERRRHNPSVDAALVDGIQVAAIVIVASNLTGAADSGLSLALHSALILVGLPLLEVLTHLLSRGVTPAARENSP